MQIRALKAFSTGTFAMEQYEIRDVDDTLAASLIAQGLAAKVGGGSGGMLVVNAVKNNNIYTLDKTWQEIRDADFAVIKIEPFGKRLNVIDASKNLEGTEFRVFAGNGVEGSTYFKKYTTTSASGYPTEE